MGMTITVDGRRYELPNLESPSIREAREIKAATGMAPLVLLDALGHADPDAWGGVVLMAMRKVDPRVAQSVVDDLDLFELCAAFEADMPDPTDAADVAAEPSDPAPLSSEG